MKRFTTFARTTRRLRTGARSAFTLIELLTTIAIIGMLSAISISTVRVSIESARTSQTETTIAKIDSALTGIYEKYQSRRVDLSDLPRTGVGVELVRAQARVLRMRDLLRRDMPCSKSELENGSALDGSFSPLQESYRFAVARSAGFGDNYNAELLYLVVTNADPEARLNFTDREIADTDGNGLYEFIDGWGRPICWLRWAPGLTSSDRQPIIPVDPMNRFDADPFDPLQVSNGWFLVPYVFSAGPDGEYGLIAPTATDFAEMNDPFTNSILDPANAPGAPDGTKTHKDNINNHTLVR